MAFDFPASPTVGAIYSPAGGPSWQWDGAKWIQVTGSTSPPVPLTAEARNRIVNGAMQISQEQGYTGSPASATLTWYSADQWIALGSTSPGTASSVLLAQVTPNGSKNRVVMTVNTAKASLGSVDYLMLTQYIEGIRIADLQWGSALAKQVILRFGFKAPAGTYSIALRNNAFDRSYVANFTVTAGQANTETLQTFVIPGDTAGTWLNDTGIGLRVAIVLAAGSALITTPGWSAGGLGTSSNTNGMATGGISYLISDVGLYLDRNNTGLPPPWVMPDEAQELAACMRYWEKTTVVTSSVANVNPTGSFLTAKRIQPALAASFAGTGAVYAAVGDFAKFWQNGAHSAGTVATITGNARM